jgi:ribosomal protein S12 methylthiotransferase accessory factor YcaO
MGDDPLDFHEYRLTRIKTEAATGYFDCRPAEAYDFDTALAWSRERPNDEFLRKHLLRLIAAWEPAALKQRIRAADGDDLFLKALFCEACILMAPFAPLRTLFSAGVQARLASASPLIFIKAHRQKDHPLHRRWIERLRPNFFEHVPLPSPREIGLATPVDAAGVARAMAAAEPLERLAAAAGPKSMPSADPSPDLAALTALALERLARAGVQVGAEMRHEASLSPIALLREWQLDLTVDSGRHRYRLTGEQISYGRGLELDHARVACVMEVVERVSSYASVSGGRVRGYRQPYPLAQARLSELNQQGVAALDPNCLGLEAPYEDAPLYWLEGRTAQAAGNRPVLVPAQAVFLFCNLDEQKLFSGLGSNGLGAGASLAQAKCKALLEVIERDSAATVPYTPELCFDVETGDARIARLLQGYAELGIRVGFLDITGPLGLPCCKCFVMGVDGEMAAGTGAHLDARRALISALTETPYPFPHGPASRPLAPAAVRVPLEALPDFDRGDAEENLALLERLLLANGFEPVYVDLTRGDLDLPVVRAFVPGMELLGDFDRFSRVHPRLYGHYLKYARPV